MLPFETPSLAPSVVSARPNSPPQTPNLSPQSTRQQSPGLGYATNGLPSHHLPFAPIATVAADASLHHPAGGPGGHAFFYTPSSSANLPEFSPQSSSPCQTVPTDSLGSGPKFGLALGLGHEHDSDGDIFIADVGDEVAAAEAAMPDVQADDTADDADDESCAASPSRLFTASDDDDYRKLNGNNGNSNGNGNDNDDADASRSMDLGFEPEGSAHFASVMTETWIVEELSDADPMESETESVQLLRPYVVEDAESSHNESSQCNCTHELHTRMMRNLRKLDFSSSSRSRSRSSSSSSSSGSDFDDFGSDDLAYLEFIRKQRELRMNKRRSQSMVSAGSKRALSELSDSDDTVDQALPDIGSGSRRTRRKTDRWSIQFAADNPPARIDEQEEPDEEELVRPGKHGDNSWDRVNLMHELPYCTLEIMEVDSS